ncbi:formate dehydrogenase family accessory protein FdhD [Sphingomonas sp. Leaf357]|uniref:formate dehydrogenase accessory sulfurtransferase FdhD n=1 Tax=Sphingomonas sp. Leaf357 TaxID=1736350 RepID=UPI0006F6AD04|nr:formate dehydrogenase accessory sulfurtransferase FdhD [Sphingomonas sp. Leaf357]KQS03462.1 formate dehydrogenase family accessory protein FdhD [Sphingomonas sp. Leaf357]
MSEGSVPHLFDRLRADGGGEAVTRAVAVERPIAIEFNGIGYAVMMATPADREDFAIGFALSERLIPGAASVLEIDVHPRPEGDILRVTLARECADGVLDRVRHRVSESSCGLCGIENLEQALRPLPAVTARSRADGPALFRALGDLRARQPLNRETGAVHAAALCSAAGEVLLVREDVGRHNAFDKLIGAMARAGIGWDGGFALLSSRCSYELVEKAALADCPLLVTISAATDLAIARAASCGLRLVMLARSDAMLAIPS